MIKAIIKANGVVEKPDIIGAVFGQTEGLLGSELDLRELQRTGRIGRIDVKIKSVKGKSDGEIIIPSSLDAAETSLIAATLETIERVGPCTAKIKLKEVEDTRSDKRKYVVDKAKEILKNLSDRGVPDSSEISEEIKEAVRTEEITEVFGLTAGPAVMESEDIVIVEGRADVINLLKFGIRNTVAIEGTSVSNEVIQLCKKKNTTLFVDGDRGGKLIAKEIMQKTELDYIAQAPDGKEVEELTQKEAYKALREKTPAKIFITEGPRRGRSISTPAEKEKTEPEKPKERAATRKPPEKKDSRTGTSRSASSSSRDDTKSTDNRRSGYSRSSSGNRSFARRDDRSRTPRGVRLSGQERTLFTKTIKELVGTRAACIYSDRYELLGRVPVSELENTLKTLEDPHAVVLDGKVNFRLNDVAKRKGVRFLVGMEKEDFYSPIAVISRQDLDK